MSRLATAIEAHQTHQHRALYEPLNDILTVTDDWRADAQIADEYHIACTFEVKSWCRGSNDVVGATQNARATIVEAVFGEFRQHILDAKRALYARDVEGARACLDKLYSEMFEV